MALADTPEREALTNPLESDEEESRFTALPKVNYARHSATMSLAASALMFCFSMVFFVRSRSQVSLAGHAATSSMVGLNQAVGPLGDVKGVFSGSSGLADSTHEPEPHGSMFAPHHLVVDSHLQTTGADGATVTLDLPSGSQVFPIRRKGGRVQVLVPAFTFNNTEMKATFGWLPTQEGGIELLMKDTQVLHKPDQPRRPPPSKEESKAKWREVRAKNQRLKSEIASVQGDISAGYSSRIRAGNSAVRAKVKEVINVEELSKEIHQLNTNLQKEIASPKKLLGKIGDVFRE